jgi:hypothetical protein
MPGCRRLSAARQAALFSPHEGWARAWYAGKYGKGRLPHRPAADLTMQTERHPATKALAALMGMQCVVYVLGLRCGASPELLSQGTPSPLSTSPTACGSRTPVDTFAGAAHPGEPTENVRAREERACDLLSWLASPLEATKNAALAVRDRFTRMMRTCDLAGELKHHARFFPEAEALRAYYLCRGTEKERRAAMTKTRLCWLGSFRRTLQKAWMKGPTARRSSLSCMTGPSA